MLLLSTVKLTFIRNAKTTYNLELIIICSVAHNWRLSRVFKLLQQLKSCVIICGIICNHLPSQHRRIIWRWFWKSQADEVSVAGWRIMERRVLCWTDGSLSGPGSDSPISLAASSIPSASATASSIITMDTKQLLTLGIFLLTIALAQGSRFSLTLYMLIHFSKNYEICNHISYHILDFVQQKNTKFIMEQHPMFAILYYQYHTCRCPGDLRSQGIIRHGIAQMSRNFRH